MTDGCQNYKSWPVYLRLLKTASPYWLSFVLGIIGTLSAVAVDAGLTWAIEPLLKNWSSCNSAPWFRLLPLIVIIILVLRGVSYFLSSYFLTSVGRNLVRDFRQRIFSHLMYLPADYHDRETSGKLLSTLIYNTEQVSTSATDALITLLQEGLFLMGLLIVMFHLSWQLTLMFMITAPAIALVVRCTSRRLLNLSSNVQKTMGNLAQIAAESIENYKVVRVFGSEKYEINKFFAAARENCNREIKVVVTNTLGSSITQIITAFPLAVIILVVTNSYLYQKLSAATISAFIFSIIRLLTPLRRLTKINVDIQRGVAGAQSIFLLLDEKLEKDKGDKSLVVAKGIIEYRNVSFNYPNSKRMILDDINICIKPGQIVALVGVSGGGKTTLINMLPRFYEPLKGKVFLDGIPIEEYKLHDLRRQFSVVSQHLTLFNDTIARNIAYGTFELATESKIIEAAEAAYVMEFVNTLPEGLNTIVGENGLLLSGGQRQRIAIARALFKNAPILILDEATSALDTQSERYIQKALDDLMGRHTTLVIAHRLSTVKYADNIVVIDKGKIIESGRHEELLKNNSYYANLYQMQFKG